MSEIYSFEHSDGITVTRFARQLEFDDFIAALDEIRQRELMPRRMWDVTGVFDFTAEQIQQIAKYSKRHFPSPARVAFLAADDLTFGLLRMFEAYREEDDHITRVFRDEQTARQWLVEQVI